jgi:peptidoglycan hydrolase-like protein with peptidoglycan-binding domain
MTRTMTRRRALGLGGGAILVGIPAISGLITTGDSSAQTNPPAAVESAARASSAGQRTATVTRRDLVRTIEANGTLTYGTRRAVRGAETGTITALAEPGAVIGWNEPLYFVDNVAGPILMNGTLPMWRSLRTGIDDGADVLQLESNLAIMGFNDDGDLTIDEKYTAATAAAVKAWQGSHGLEKTGRVEQGAVWFSPEPVRIAAVRVAVGDPASGEILTVTSTTRVIHVDLDAKHAQLATPMGKVDIELVDGTVAIGTISSVATVATINDSNPSQPATTTVGVDITPDTELDALDESPVTVSFTSSKVADTLAVPVETIVATADGRHALEIVNADGTTRLVEVTLGRFADGWVQIDGDVPEGTTVLSA